MPCTGSTSISGILRAARAKLASSSAPSMMSALVSPSLAKFFCSAPVLPSFTVAFSSTMMPPSLALADRACLRASARTFFGRSIAWLRGVGPNERPPPRKRLTRAEPWRAEPVPFCRYIFLPVRLISLRFLTSWVPRSRLASCQRTQRCRMSALGSRPKIASGSSIEPAALPSSDTILSSMSGALLVGGFAWFGGRGLGVGLGGCRLRQAELAGLGSVLRQLLLHSVAQRDPAALGARHRAFDQDEAALDVGLHHLEIERGDALDSHVTRHFLVLEGLAGILAAAGGTDRAMRDRHAVRGAQPAEIPALHATGKAFADRGPGHVDKLPDDEVIGGDLGTDRDQIALLHPELGELALGLDLGDGEMAAVRLGQVLWSARAGAELQRHVAVLVLGAVGDDLAIGEAQHSDRHVLAAVRKDAGHPDLLCDHPGTHVWCPVSCGSELDFDVDAGGKIELHQRVHRLRRRIDDVEQPLVRTHLELLTALLVDVRRTVDRELLDPRRQRDRAAHLRASALGGRHDLARRRIEDAVIERLEPDPNILAVHGCSDSGKLRTSEGRRRTRIPLPISHPPFRRRSSVVYSVIDTTTPAPTVLPPSRIANRCFSSIAIGVINSTSIAALSPGMIISVPAGSVT